MAPETTLVGDYLATLARGSEEVELLERVPWIVGTHRQDAAHIREGLRAEASWFAEVPHPFRPLFSLITPLWNTPPRLLHELILSVRLQSWLRWELILVDDGSTETDHLEVARAWAAHDERIRFSVRATNGGISAARNEAVARSSGDFLAILDHDDLLHPMALSTFVRHLHGRPDVNLLYSNEAKISESSDRVIFYLHKPPFDVATLLRANYLCHFTAIHRDLLTAAAPGGVIFRPEYDGVEDHDLFLRVALTGRVCPLHVPACLYYWRMVATSTATSPAAKIDIEPRRKAMLDELLPEAYPGSSCQILPPSPDLGGQYPSIRISALAHCPGPKLLVMIPFRDQLELTLRCCEALERQQHDLDVHVLLINNHSNDPVTMVGLRRWLSEPRYHSFEVVDHEGAFNFGRIHNNAVAHHGAGQDLLMFLNNDVGLISPDCLQTLAMHLLAAPGHGFAGIRLHYPDGGVQHGGIKIHADAQTSGCPNFVHATQVIDYVAEERVVFAVTFACAMVRRVVFEGLGGLDELLFPNSYGDVDIQARALEKGFHNHYFGTLTGIHHESKSRKRVSEETEFLALHARHAQVISDWKLRSFNLSLQTWGQPEPASVPVPEPAAGVTSAPEPVVVEQAVPTPALIPLRYKVADRLNAVLKAVLGPVHTLLKAGIVRGRRRLRPLAAGRTSGLPPRPKHLQRLSGGAGGRVGAGRRR